MKTSKLLPLVAILLFSGCATQPESPDPTRPELPARLVGSVGAEDGTEKTIRGQCFIATRGGVNYKLGGVVVRVVGTAEYQELMKQALIAFLPTYDYVSTMSDLSRNRMQFDLAMLYLDQAQASLYQISDIFPVGPQTLTDSDGNFEIRHKLREPYVVVGHARRSIGSTTEYYRWSVPSSEIGSDGRLLLYNANVE